MRWNLSQSALVSGKLVASLQLPSFPLFSICWYSGLKVVLFLCSVFFGGSTHWFKMFFLLLHIWKYWLSLGVTKISNSKWILFLLCLWIGILSSNVLKSLYKMDRNVDINWTELALPKSTWFYQMIDFYNLSNYKYFLYFKIWNYLE